MKIIFVGIHNKPGKTPLDSSTRSGQIVDEIMKIIPGEFVKSNLYDQDTEPPLKQTMAEEMPAAMDWGHRVNYEPRDIVVPLGARVAAILYAWRMRVGKISGSFPVVVGLAHPSPRVQRTDEAVRKYINEAVIKISSVKN